MTQYMAHNSYSHHLQHNIFSKTIEANHSSPLILGFWGLTQTFRAFDQKEESLNSYISSLISTLFYI